MHDINKNLSEFKDIKYNTEYEWLINLLQKVISNKKDIDKKLSKSKMTAYIGFDATSDSLHIGSLLQLMLLSWFQYYGNKPMPNGSHEYAFSRIMFFGDLQTIEYPVIGNWETSYMPDF